MDIGLIKEFSSSVKVKSQKEIPLLIQEYFGEMEHQKLLEDLFCFTDKFPTYKKLLTLVIKSIKPDVFCVYVLKCNGYVVYVGKSTDVCVRLNTHSKEKDFDEVFIIETKDKQSQDLCENSLILKYKPKYNKSVNIKNTNRVVDFDKDLVKFIDWLNHTNWFSGVSQQLQAKLGYKIELKSFNSFIDSEYAIHFKTETSFVLSDATNDPKKNTSHSLIKTTLERSAIDLGKPELFSVVTDGMYKFGKFFISSKGRWRVEGGNKWYFNVDVDKIIRDTLESFNVVDIDAPTLEFVPIWFGKYRGKLFSDVKEIDQTYCEWVVRTFKQSELARLGAV